MKIINPSRICPECGASFIAHHGRQTFCQSAHQKAFHDRNSVRGKVLLPLAQAWRSGRGSGDVGKYALRELCALLDGYSREDKAAGRVPLEIVKGRQRAGWAAADLG